MRHALILALLLSGCAAAPDLPTSPALPEDQDGIATAQALFSVRLVSLSASSFRVHADGPTAGPIVWECLECPGYDLAYRGPGPVPPDPPCKRILPLVQADGRTAMVRRQTRQLYKVRVRGAMYGSWSPYLDVLPGFAQ